MHDKCTIIMVIFVDYIYVYIYNVLKFQKKNLFYFFCKCSNRRIWFANPNTSQTWKKEHYLDPMFFKEFFYVAKVAILYRELLKIWQWSLRNFWQNLVKKPDMKHKSWIILLHFFATYWKPNVKTKCIFTFLLTFGNWNF